MIVRCLKLARKEGIKLRRRYGKEIKQRKLECRFAGHSKNRAKARKAVKRKIWKVLSRDQGFTLSIRTLGRILKKLLRLNRIVPVAFYFGRIKPKRRRPFKHHARRWRYGMKARQPGELMQIDHMSVGFSEGFQLKEFKATCPVTGTTIMRTYSSASSRNARRFLDDADGDALHSLRIDTLPGTGSLALNSTAVTAMQVIAAADIPNLVYTPVANVNGAATFTFSVSDGTDFSTPPATATITVNAVNADPSGTVTITGTPQVGQTLTADTSGIADADGPAALSFTYQWLANDGTTNEAINGATSPTYLLTGNESGETITVSVRYTDAGNTAEGPLTSDPVGPVVAAPAPAPEVLNEEQAMAQGVEPARTDSAGTTITLPTSEPVDVSNASTADFRVTSTLNDVETVHRVTAIRQGSIILEVEPAIPAGASIMVSYTLPAQGSSIIGTTTRTPLVRFSLPVVNPNRAPTADAGTDQTVAEGASVTLNGSGSSDPESANLTYAWTQVGTPAVTLTGDTTATPTFTAPENLPANAVLEFMLTVTDLGGASDTDSVRISVTTDAPARQQALKTGLAAFARSLAASATDAIGQRLKPAATGPETSAFSGLSLANCIANMTSLTPTDTASADGADSTDWFDPRDLGGDIGSAEPDNNSRNNGRNPLGACRLPDSGQLARSAFVIPLNSLSGKGNAGAGGGYWSLWGRGDLSRFEGRPQTGLDLDGDLRAGYLGLDYRLSSGGLVGVALSRSEGEIDYRSGTTDGALDNGTFDEGTLDTSLNSVYPYGYWSPRAGLGLWGLLGVGSGDATLSHRETAFATDLDMRMGALGLRAQWRAQELLAHSASGFEEWGTSLNVQLDPGVSGRGLALTLAPTWGQAASGGAQALWQSDRPLRARLVQGLAPASAMRMDLDLSYGLNRDRRQLSPFASLGLADGVMQRLRLGLRLGLGLGLADELEMELFGGRNASGNRSPEHLLGLTGRLRF